MPHIVPFTVSLAVIVRCTKNNKIYETDSYIITKLGRPVNGNPVGLQILQEFGVHPNLSFNVAMNTHFIVR